MVPGNWPSSVFHRCCRSFCQPPPPPLGPPLDIRPPPVYDCCAARHDRSSLEHFVSL